MDMGTRGLLLFCTNLMGTVREHTQSQNLTKLHHWEFRLCFKRVYTTSLHPRPFAEGERDFVIVANICVNGTAECARTANLLFLSLLPPRQGGVEILKVPLSHSATSHHNMPKHKSWKICRGRKSGWNDTTYAFKSLGLMHETVHLACFFLLVWVSIMDFRAAP
jgi:hypothetical protein